MPARRELRTIGLAVMAVGLAAVLRYFMFSVFETNLPLLTFIAAVAFTAWLGGLVPGVLATLLSLIPAYSIMLETSGTSTLSTGNFAGLVLYTLIGFGISAIADAQQQARFRAQNLELQLRFVTDHAPVMLVHCDTQTRYKFVNRTYAERYGKTPEQIVGRRIVDIVGETAYASFAGFVQQALAGQSVEFESEIPYEFGPRFMHVVYTPDRDSTGRVQGIICAILDITEHRRIAEALRRSEVRFRLAAEAVNGIVYEYDFATDTFQRTRGLTEVLGHIEHDVPKTGDWWRSQIHPDDQERIKADRVSAQFEGTLLSRYRIRHADGAWRHVEDRGMVMLDDDGRPAKIIGCTTDISDHVRQSEELREADRRKDIFLATLAHELRNPLAPLRNGLNVMKLAGVGEALEPTRRMMDRQLTQLVRLVDDLLDIGRVNRNKLDLRRERVDLHSVVEAAVETVKPLLDESGHTLTVDLPPEPLVFDGDAARIAQVFANLLHNSVKYTHRGGTITLCAARRTDDVEVTVSDTGIGIPPAMLHAVFDMFTQVDRRLEKTTGGLGIGLSLVKGLVEMHSGTIVAASEGEGHGSTFTVRLPLVNTMSSSATMPSLGSVSTAGAGPGLQTSRES